MKYKLQRLWVEVSAFFEEVECFLRGHTWAALNAYGPNGETAQLGEQCLNCGEFR